MKVSSLFLLVALGVTTQVHALSEEQIQEALGKKPKAAASEKSSSGKSHTARTADRTVDQENSLERLEKDRLMLAAENKWKAGDRSGAMADWRAVAQRGGRLPADLNFFLGRGEYSLSHPDEAERYLKAYVSSVGNGGSHYNEVLGMLNQVEGMRTRLAQEKRDAEARQLREQQEARDRALKAQQDAAQQQRQAEEAARQAAAERERAPYRNQVQSALDCAVGKSRYQYAQEICSQTGRQCWDVNDYSKYANCGN